jgi:hypothetical protein
MGASVDVEHHCRGHARPRVFRASHYLASHSRCCCVRWPLQKSLADHQRRSGGCAHKLPVREPGRGRILGIKIPGKSGYRHREPRDCRLGRPTLLHGISVSTHDFCGGICLRSRTGFCVHAHPSRGPCTHVEGRWPPNEDDTPQVKTKPKRSDLPPYWRSRFPGKIAQQWRRFGSSMMCISRSGSRLGLADHRFSCARGGAKCRRSERWGGPLSIPHICP